MPICIYRHIYIYVVYIYVVYLIDVRIEKNKKIHIFESPCATEGHASQESSELFLIPFWRQTSCLWCGVVFGVWCVVFGPRLGVPEHFLS